MSEELYETGLATRREVLGEEYVDAAIAGADDFNREFQHLVTEYCWGAAWSRGVLTRRDRSLLNLVMLGALGRAEEFKLHTRAALRNGCTREEISRRAHPAGGLRGNSSGDGGVSPCPLGVCRARCRSVA